MTRSRFFASSDDRKGEPSAVAHAAAPISSIQMSNPGSSSNGSASRWRRPRLRRSHAHQFSEALLAEKPAAIAPALSRDSLGSGYTEAPSSRGTSAETLSACSPAAGVLSEGSLQADGFDLDEGSGPSSCEDDELSWLEEDMPPSEEGGAAGDSDGEFDEFVHHRHQHQQRQRYSGPLELCVQDFECGECIGKGSYSRVYLGNHAPTRTEWALKVVSKRKTFETRENLAHLREEKYISTKLQGSDFLVRTAGTFQNPRSVVFAMEYLPGGDLYQRLSDKGTLSLGEAVAWTAQAVLAIEDLHGKSIVHRDIKPENFLMGKSGTLKLTDFGFARELEPDERLYSQFGTPEYVAPEVLNGSGHGMAVDLWALGVLIYELLVGQTPFKSSTVDEMYERIATGDYAFPAPPVVVARKRTGSSQRGPSAKSAGKDSKKAAAAKSSPLCGHVQQKVGAGLKRGISFKKTGSQVAAAMAAAVAEAGLEDGRVQAGTSSGRSSSSSSSSSAEKRQREQQRQPPNTQLEKPRRQHQHQQQQQDEGSANRHSQQQESKKGATSKSASTSKNAAGATGTSIKHRATGSAAQDPAAQSLVKALLCLSPARRPTLDEIKCHAFFAGVDFDGLRAAVRAQAEQEEEDAVVSAAIDGGDVWVRGQPVVCRSEEMDDNYGGVFEGF